LRVLVVGGGTAGHINPGIAIANYIREKDNSGEIVFVGTKNGLENKLVPRAGYQLKTIRAKGLSRKIGLDLIKFVKIFFEGIFDSVKIIKEFKPDIVIGTGGYVCGAVILIARIQGIPALIHESNSIPGITNKFLSKITSGVAISFSETKRFFKGSKLVKLTGNPIRKDLLDIDREKAKDKINMNSMQSTVLIFGGSRGAEKVNKCVAEMIKNKQNEFEFNLIFATGEKHFDNVVKETGKLESDKIKILPYIYDMASTLAAADLVISRAGAVSVSEFAALTVPSILIPSPYVTANHQEYNARELERAGGAVIILEKELSSEILFEQIRSLIGNKEELSKMSNNLKKVGIRDATEKIYSMILEVTKR
jgi:UDP-N-acetylglucosamine--N-acetylmuramyl-(pentapeptide) pyrophosphoryl-undecaprenol N-acetylglucosamine transferase